MPATDSNNDKPSVLKDTREAKGLTLEIVHEATKIPMDALRSIEEGYSSRILSPFYFRGFIKIYAEFLGLDVKEIFKQYGLDQPPKPTSSATVAAAKASVKVEGPNVFLEQAQESLAVAFKPKTLKFIVKVIAVLFLFFLLFKMGGCIASHIGKRSAPIAKRSSVVYQEKKVKVKHYDWDESSTAASTPVPQEAKQSVVSVQSQNNKVEVAVRAVKNTWIQVKTDGSVVFQMTLNKGSMESWSADDRIELSGRNLEQLDMEVNGKHIGPLGGGERRIRRVLINKEGLTVKK